MDVQATLLYRTLRPVDIDALVQAVNSWINIPDMAVVHSPQAGDTHLLLSNPNFHAVLSITHDRAPFDMMESALNAPILATKDFDYADALQAHRMHVTVTVGDGPMHLSPEVKQWMTRMGKHQSAASAPLDHKLVVLNAITQVLCGHDVPELLHWQQSDMVYTPDEIIEAGDMLFPLPLVVRPTPIYGASAEGGHMAGLRLDFSDIFAGRTVVMEPSPLPMAESLGIAMWLLSQKTDGSMDLEHGGKLAIPGFPTLHFRHEMADSNDPKGRIIITETAPELYAMKPAEVRPVLSHGGSVHQAAPAPAYQAQYAPAPAAQPQPAQVAPAPQPLVAPAPAPAPVAAAPAPAPVPAPAPAPAPAPVATQPEPAPAPAHNGSIAGLAQVAQQQKEQVAKPVAETVEAPAEAPAQAPAPKPAADIQSKGWANAAQARDMDSAASTQVFAPAMQGKTGMQTAKSLKPSLNNPTPGQHAVDVAAGLKATAEAEQAANTPDKPRGMASRLHLRAISGVVAMFLVVAAGLTLAPKFLEDGVEVATSTAPQTGKPSKSNLVVNTGPRVPGLN